MIWMSRSYYQWENKK